MKFNFDFTLVNLEGEALTDPGGAILHAGRALASLIMQSPEAGPDIMVKYDWATELHKTGSIDLDRAGQAQFKKMIENFPGIYLIVRGRLLEVFDKRNEELTVK
jgi:hypothetical protein